MVGGTTRAAQTDYLEHAAFMRLCADGSLDDGTNCGAGGFGVGGRKVNTFGDTTSSIRSLTIQSSDKQIVAAGNFGALAAYSNQSIAIARFEAGTSAVTITGKVGIAGATLNYIDGTAQTAIADASGNYTITVSGGWSGIITPTLSSVTRSHLLAAPTLILSPTRPDKITRSRVAQVLAPAPSTGVWPMPRAPWALIIVPVSMNVVLD